jgi:hypothetical protein
VPLKSFKTDNSSSTWRTAYTSALFEVNPVRLQSRILEAHAAIKERLDSHLEIPRLEREAIDSAQQRLATLEVASVELVVPPSGGGDTNL